MNTYQTDLYNDLITLCNTRDLFYFKDHELDGLTYRVFSYHMGSYTDFCLPSALECRGPLFLMDDALNPVDLVSLPQPKIFNWQENPFTMDVDFDEVTTFEEKADGSLISTYIHNGKLRLKSKTALASPMALGAMELLSTKHTELQQALEYYALRGLTTIMEWCDSDPVSRIVLFYDRPQLRIFGMRSSMTGEHIDYRSDDAEYLLNNKIIDAQDPESTYFRDILIEHSVDRFHMTGAAAQEFAASVSAETGVEGYVMINNNNDRIKLKTQWYVTQHRLKDSITNDVALFTSVIAGSSDDLKGIFHDNPDAVRVINAMEDYALPLFAKFIKNVESYHELNREIDRRSYAIKGQEVLSKQEFACAMQLYLGNDVSYSKIIIKNAKSYVAAYSGNVIEKITE